MIKPITKKTWLTLCILAVISTCIFLVIEVIGTDQYKRVNTFGKENAESVASKFIYETTGVPVIDAEAIHYANKEYTGYLDKYKLNAEHKDKFNSFVPFDQYKVGFRTASDHIYGGNVYLDIYSGKIIGWEITVDEPAAPQEQAEQFIIAQLEEINYPYLADMSISPRQEKIKADWLGTKEIQATQYYVASESASIKDAQLKFEASVISTGTDTFINKFMPKMELPSSYTKLVARQDLYAAIWTFAVYFLISLVLGVLAIIYAILYRKFTSFKYGIFLTSIALIASAIINMGLFKSGLVMEDLMVSDGILITITTIIIIIISVIFGAVSYYFSFVAGYGLWKYQGFNVWPRFKEEGYGQHVWDAMKVGYLMAIIGLGLQAVIFKVLASATGMWTANDTSQSLLNFEYSWLFPVIAWMAAISEEVVFRYFGVAIFRRWFKNTWIAALIPTVAWAAAHTMYPLYPASTRVIELIIIGYLFTWVMMRFGLIAGMFMHAVFNTILIAGSMFVLGNTVDMISAVFFLVLPVIVAFIVKVLHKNKKNTEEPIAPPYPPVMPQE